MSRLIAGCATVLALVVGVRTAAAQHCHVPELCGAGRDWWMRAAATAVAGSTDVVGELRDYQGLSLSVQVGSGRYSGRVALPAYRVAAEGIGIGDAMLAGAIDLVPRSLLPRAGITATVSAPTGDADSGRGMGHVMVSAGAWARLMWGRAEYGVGAMLGRALGDKAEHVAHQHGGGAGWPLVDPMNPSELMIDASAIVALVPGQLRAGVTLVYAEPIELEGERRLIAGVVTELLRGPYTARVQVSVPLLGNSFVARGLVEVAYRY